MTRKKEKLRNEDRIIGSLEIIRWRLVEAVDTIIKEIDYLEKVKRIK